jgi:hypothetical protein
MPEERYGLDEMDGFDPSLLGMQIAVIICQDR